MITFLAVGDIMLGRGVGLAISKHGPLFPFERVKQLLKSGDVVFGNLEGAVSSRGTAVSYKDPRLVFRFEPSVVGGLANAGFNLLSLANNHLTDYGDLALMDTIEILKANGIKSIGAGRNLQEATAPAYFTIGGIVVAFLAFNAFIPFCQSATRSKAGVAPFRASVAKKTVLNAKMNSDVVVVSVHWGIDYQKCPIPMQRNLAKELIEIGATCVIGHHPHRVQGIEILQHGLICHSLGNFLFDEPFDETKESVIFKGLLNNSGLADYELIPCTRNDSFQCEIPKGQRLQQILGNIHELSRHLTENDPRIEAMDEMWIVMNLGFLLRTGNIKQYFKTLGLKQGLLRAPIVILKKSLQKLIQLFTFSNRSR